MRRKTPECVEIVQEIRQTFQRIYCISVLKQNQFKWEDFQTSTRERFQRNELNVLKTH